MTKGPDFKLHLVSSSGWVQLAHESSALPSSSLVYVALLYWIKNKQKNYWFSYWQDTEVYVLFPNLLEMQMIKYIQCGLTGINQAIGLFKVQVCTSVVGQGPVLPQPLKQTQLACNFNTSIPSAETPSSEAGFRYGSKKSSENTS